MDLAKILYVLRAIGFRGIFRTIVNSFYKDWIDNKYTRKSKNISTIFPGNFESYEQIPGGIHSRFTNFAVKIQYLTASMIRVAWSPGKPPLPYTIDISDWDFLQPAIEATPNEIILKDESLSAILDFTGKIRFADSENSIIFSGEPPSKTGDRWRLENSLNPEDHIYGLGERAGSVNLRPGHYRSWNKEANGKYISGSDPLYIGTPIYLCLSNAGNYLIYFENSYDSKYEIIDKFISTFDGGELHYYFIFGTLENIYKELAALLGKPYFPPRWSLGYHQSRWGYKSEQDIINVARGFKEHNLPISAIHLDIDYMNGFRVFSINPSTFPNMKELSRKLDNEGIKLVASINPAVKRDKGYKVYRDGLEKDVFCKLPSGRHVGGVSWPGWSVFPDFSKQRIRNWWSEHYKYLIDQGISGFWHDMNEPASFSAWGDPTLPLAAIHGENGHKGDHKEFHNLYGLLMNKAAFEGIRKSSPEKRPWILSRSGWAGLQKYAWNWTGDVETSWESLRQTIPTILGLSLSGHFFAGVDIGGFTGDPEAELYLRWFQLSTFLPFFRTHSAIGTKPREPWEFGDDVTDIVRTFLQLRYKLMPYLYSVIWETSQNGTPAIKPVFWLDPEDMRLWDIQDEFCLGDSMILAPIIENGARRRRITLPAGIWYSYWDDHRYVGPTQFDCEAPLTILPIFVRGGSVLPMEGGDTLTLHIYPALENSSSTHLYSDSGDGYGDWRLDTLESNFSQNSLDINWKAKGKYPFPYSQISIAVHSVVLDSGNVDGNQLVINNNSITTFPFNRLILTFKPGSISSL